MQAFSRVRRQRRRFLRAQDRAHWLGRRMALHAGMHDDLTHAGGPGRLPLDQAGRATKAITLASMAVAGSLCVLKAFAFAASGSTAMLASLADSGLDLAASIVTHLAVRYAVVPADAEHRFGHGKAEAFAALFQAGLVVLSAALVGREAIERMVRPEPIEAGAWALAVMTVSIVATLGLVWAQTHALRKTGSVAVAGDRAHYAADLAANVAVMIGIAAAAFFNILRADALVGLVVAAWLVWGAWGVAKGALDQMMDRELDERDRQAIEKAVLADPQVKGVHQLRTRAAGPLIHVQMHVDLDQGLSLAEAHRIMIGAEARILAKFPSADVLIHPDPRGAAQAHGLAHFKAESEDGAA